MAVKDINYKGKSVDEIKAMSLKEFAKLIPSRQRRSLSRGFTDAQKKFLKKLEKKGNNVKTHCRSIVIVPQMLDKHILVHSGKQFVAVTIVPEMLGHYLGEFVLTRLRVAHSAPGVGATRSSASVSVR
ncbi:MAG: 30S ribosomal protein S19 [Candidatus Woesearchaeota archaeon]